MNEEQDSLLIWMLGDKHPQRYFYQLLMEDFHVWMKCLEDVLLHEGTIFAKLDFYETLCELRGC